VTTKDLKAGDELFSAYAPTVDGDSFLRLVFKDFLEYLVNLHFMFYKYF
jgi:hypothetical protein